MPLAQLRDTSRRLVLCVEDERDLLDDIIGELQSSGYDAVGARDGQEALQALSVARPDLILCDISMPKMDGYRFLETVRQDRKDLADVPFVFLTALNHRDELISGRRAGADDYLVKPIDYDVLLVSIEARIAQAERVRDFHKTLDPAVRSGEEWLPHLNGEEPGQTAGILNIMGFGVILAGQNAEVIFANRFARQLSGETACFFLSERLRAATPDLTRALRGHVAEVASASLRDEDMMRGMAVPLDGDDGEVLFVICSFADGNSAQREGVAAIFVCDPRRRPTPPDHVLAALFALTPAEAQIAHGLVSGKRTAEIAKDLEVSQTTVAFHLRNVFEKTGTHRQVDLVAMIIQSLAALK